RRHEPQTGQSPPVPRPSRSSWPSHRRRAGLQIPTKENTPAQPARRARHFRQEAIPMPDRPRHDSTRVEGSGLPLGPPPPLVVTTQVISPPMLPWLSEPGLVGLVNSSSVIVYLVPSSVTSWVSGPVSLLPWLSRKRTLASCE